MLEHFITEINICVLFEIIGVDCSTIFYHILGTCCTIYMAVVTYINLPLQN